MKANSDKSKQSNKATRRVLAGVLCGASVLSLVLSLVMPPISQAIANDSQTVSAEETVMGGGSSSESTDVDNTTNGDAKNQNSDETENGASEGTDAADSTADGAEVKGAEQPSDAQSSDNENSDENAIAPVSAEDYQDVHGNVATAFDGGGKYRLSGESWSDSQIAITANTTIDLNGNMLYHRPGSVESFIVVQNNATLTIEDSSKVNDATSPVTNNPGRPAQMTWTGSNGGTPQSLTYYETTSAPKSDGPGTTETTTQHTVSGFGAIVAASDEGSVQQVISVEDSGTLNLNGGMITTPRDLTNNGHIIYAEGKSNETHVNINGGFITGANLNQQRGGWGGGLCVAGAKVTVNMTGGVIAANKAASGGGIFADSGVTLNLSGGVISGNATYDKGIGNSCGGDTGDGGYGGGVYTKGANVTIGGSANITNNRVDAWITDSNLYNFGLLGGGGIACTHRGTLTMTGGSVTANYSKEAGGGIYAGFWNQAITFKMTGGTIAGNESVNAEGGGLRISTGTTGDIGTEPGAFNKVYITNNKTMTGESRGGDWGGGGVFVQKDGKLNIVRTLITDNEAGGWGGGIGACPTGETIVSHSNGAAIYNNTDNGLSNHMSAGGNSKNEDSNPEYITDDFKTAGHKDFFLVRKKGSDKTVAVVLGKMLGNGSAGWKGTCDGQKIAIDPNGGAEAKYMFGLEAHPTDEAVEKAQVAATTIISGNYSFTHGGGIMTNGDLTVGEVAELSVYPNMKLNATKVLKDAEGNSQSLEGHAYKFKLLRQEGSTEPSWKDDGMLDMGECSVAGEATVESDGSITFDSGKDYSSGQYVFYLVEEPISGDNELDTKFDKTIYKIVATVDNNPYKTDHLMAIPINYYKVNKVTVCKKAEGNQDFVELDRANYSVTRPSDNNSSNDTTTTVVIGDNDNPTFINKIEPYTSLGSWKPAATKVVKGGEMKEFTLEFADNDKFNNAKRVTTKAGGDNPQKLYFPDIEYGLKDLKQKESDDPGRGACKDFTYYVRESAEVSRFSQYKYDKSVYRFDVRMKDQEDGSIEAESVTYTKIKGTDGKDIATKDQHSVNFDGTKPESTPTFTNIYSTSLPLSGMSGVTLTYLAGAAVLCAAAAWMHIRRKANAKGGERRE